MGEPRAKPTTSKEPAPNLSSLCLTITERAPLPMAMVEGASHIVRYVNPAFCLLTTKSKKELVGKTFREVMPEKNQCLTLLDQVHRTEQPITYTEQQPATPHLFRSYTMWPVKADECPMGVMVVVNETSQLHEEMVAVNEALILGSVRQHELTEASDKLNVQLQEEIRERKRSERALRESEERFASIFNQSTAGIGQVDVTGRYVLVNKRLCQLAGRSRKELLKLRMQDITHPEDVPKTGERFRALVEGRSENFVIETRYRRPDGTALWVHSDVAAIRDANDKVRSLVAVVADLTERKRLEEDLAKRNEELAAIDTAKNQFLAELSHELRSPLNIIILWSQIIQRPGRSEDTLRKGLDAIYRSSKAQAQLVEDLLDVHRISSGKVRLEFAAVDLVEILHSAVESTTLAAAEKAIRIDRKIGRVPAVVYGDAARLQQVLGNVLGNAVKFTPEGGQIRVALCRKDARVEVRVSDTGQGISAAGLLHIFERFRQTDPHTSHTRGGLGLGLSIAKQLVELHGGKITAESPGKGGGATFLVSFPLVAAKKRPRRPVLSVKRAAGKRPPSLSGVLVLVVDDEPDAREVVRRVLEDADAETIVVRSTDEALDAFRQQRPDMILSDIGMPGRDGYDLVRTIRTLPPGKGGRVPAIALTAHAGSEDRDRALSAGFQTHLAKPVEPAKLISAVAALVPRARGSGTRRGKKAPGPRP